VPHVHGHVILLRCLHCSRRERLYSAPRSNLIFLKKYDGDNVEDLCLTFTVTDEAFGATREVELVPRGASRTVTSRNRLEYVNRVAKHHLVDNVSRVYQLCACACKYVQCVRARWRLRAAVRRPRTAPPPPLPFTRERVQAHTRGGSSLRHVSRCPCLRQHQSLTAGIVR
jgi:HECT-domain (ubiquitin-transferase)